MNRLVIIGNGFDLAHGLKTSYKDFIEWYWEQRKTELRTCNNNITNDGMCELRLISHGEVASWMNLFLFYKDLREMSGRELFNIMQNDVQNFSISIGSFFSEINKSIETKGWVDIENIYYNQLKKNADNPNEIVRLNNDLLFIQNKLLEYLKTLETPNGRSYLYDEIIKSIEEEDISFDGKEKALNDILTKDVEDWKKWIPDQILHLSFNYTNTIEQYYNYNVTINYIHGQVSTPQKVIFGYGDELDRDYHDLVDRNNNELLRYSKSSKYLEADNYRKLLQFLESRPFQVLIMGHSCGNSDRTLLNTIFEHRNCVSIKPYYYIKQEGSDNYLELVQNISRNFTDMKLFRDRVVNKTRCKTM